MGWVGSDRSSQIWTVSINMLAVTCFWFVRFDFAVENFHIIIKDPPSIQFVDISRFLVVQIQHGCRANEERSFGLQKVVSIFVLPVRDFVHFSACVYLICMNDSSSQLGELGLLYLAAFWRIVYNFFLFGVVVVVKHGLQLLALVFNLL